MRIFNFVNLESLIYMKLYNLLILNKIQNCTINNVKVLKKRNKLYFQDVYCHVGLNKFVSISDGMIKVTTYLHQ